MKSIPKSTAKEIYETIKMEICTSVIEPSMFISEQQIADRFRVSRTPVREALTKLEHDGLIKTIPKVGSFVTQVTLQDLIEMDEIRMLLEPYLAKNAVGRVDISTLESLEKQLTELNRENPNEQDYLKLVEIDEQVHNLILNTADNNRLKSIISNLMKIKSIVTLRATKKRYNEGITEHLTIIKALKAQDAATAEKAMLEHIQNANDNYPTFLPVNKLNASASTISSSFFF